MMPCGFNRPQVLQHRPVFTSSALQWTLWPPPHRFCASQQSCFLSYNLCASREAGSSLGSREQISAQATLRQAFPVSSTLCVVQSRAWGLHCSNWGSSQASYQEFCNKFFSLLDGVEGRCEGWSCCSHFTILGYLSQHAGEIRAKKTGEE